MITLDELEHNTRSRRRDAAARLEDVQRDEQARRADLARERKPASPDAELRTLCSLRVGLEGSVADLDRQLVEIEEAIADERRTTLAAMEVIPTGLSARDYDPFEETHS